MLYTCARPSRQVWCICMLCILVFWACCCVENFLLLCHPLVVHPAAFFCCTIHHYVLIALVLHLCVHCFVHPTVYLCTACCAFAFFFVCASLCCCFVLWSLHIFAHALDCMLALCTVLLMYMFAVCLYCFDFVRDSGCTFVHLCLCTWLHLCVVFLTHSKLAYDVVHGFVDLMLFFTCSLVLSHWAWPFTTCIDLSTNALCWAFGLDFAAPNLVDLAFIPKIELMQKCFVYVLGLTVCTVTYCACRR